MNRISISHLAAAILLAGLLPASGQQPLFPGSHAVTHVPVKSGYCEVMKVGFKTWQLTGWCVERSTCAKRYTSYLCPPGTDAPDHERFCHTPVSIQFPCD